MTNKPIIIWEKWRDPYGLDDIRDIKDGLNGMSAENNNYLDNEEEDQEDQEDVASIIPHKSSLPVIATPMGLVPYTENTACTKIFNFWTGHTNFDITKDIAQKIELCGGVETLNVFTRYRFRISIGKAFDDAVTMKLINDTIYPMMETHK
jgi:hypothetical protein